jgi:protein-L-isoaspartate(D-aspartate) O-methyltransferase
MDESDYRAARAGLRRILEKRGLRDASVLAAIESTQRHLFVPERIRHRAYQDDALPLTLGQTISQPYIVALMTENLGLSGAETVLEIGTGSGYQTAIIAQLCHRVVSIERLDSLATGAQQLLVEMGISNVEFHTGDGTLGFRQAAPYDGILVTAAAPSVPEPLMQQLKIGGRIVIPVGDESIQTLKLIEKHAYGSRSVDLCSCRFVKLIGAAAWDDPSAE